MIAGLDSDIFQRTVGFEHRLRNSLATRYIRKIVPLWQHILKDFLPSASVIYRANLCEAAATEEGGNITSTVNKIMSEA